MNCVLLTLDVLINNFIVLSESYTLKLHCRLIWCEILQAFPICCMYIVILMLKSRCAEQCSSSILFLICSIVKLDNDSAPLCQKIGTARSVLNTAETQLNIIKAKKVIYNTLCTICTRDKNAFKNIIRLALSANLFSLLNDKWVTISNVAPLDGSLLFWKNPYVLKLKD